MTTLEEIEKAIEELPDEEFLKLREWLAKLEADRWDKQIEQDAMAGKLDKLAEQALAEHRAGKTINLPGSRRKS